jgi:hypothetical protein
LALILKQVIMTIQMVSRGSLSGVESTFFLNKKELTVRSSRAIVGTSKKNGKGDQYEKDV